MRNSKYCLFFISLLSFQGAWSETILVDPISGKSIEHYTTVVKFKSNELNAFEDVELQPIVIKNNKELSDVILHHLQEMITSLAYKTRLEAHQKRSIKNLLARESYPENDVAWLKEQGQILEIVGSEVMFYYNGYIGIRIISSYTINERQNLGKEMTQCVYLNVNTGKMVSLLELCPSYLREQFVVTLTQLNNAFILRNKLNYLQKERNEGYRFDEEEEPMPQLIDSISKRYFIQAIDMGEIVFDANAYSFSSGENGANTIYSYGAATFFELSPDSVAYFLPFVIVQPKGLFSANISPQKINKVLLSLAYNGIAMINEPNLREYFEATQKSGTVDLLYCQKFVQDTTFKLVSRGVYNASNKITSFSNDYDNAKEAKKTQRFSYNENNDLVKVAHTYKGEASEQETFSYNQEGFLVRYKTSGNEDEDPREYTYSYNALSGSECRLDDGKKECYTLVFDALGNMLTHTAKGTKPTWKNVYSGNLLMAQGDALFSYNAKGQIENKERDRGRYYTTYEYNQKGQLVRISTYDSNELTNQFNARYDAQDRINFYDIYNYSYGKMSTVQEFKLVYR
jgi:hypothetical protein